MHRFTTLWKALPKAGHCSRPSHPEPNLSYQRHFSPVRLRTSLTLISTMLFMLFVSSQAKAQDEVPKVEVGVHFSALPLDDDPTNNFICQVCDTFTYTGIGGRFTYNLTNSLALESEMNFFLRENKRMRSRRVGGLPVQGLFGVKAGKRFEKIGVFAKARPGFISFSDTIQSGLGQFSNDFFRRTHFNLDVGGVVEFYPSRRIVIRADVGDTIIWYREENLAGALIPFSGNTTHNLQFNVGVGFRF